MYTLILPTLMYTFTTPDDLAGPQPHDRPVVERLRRAWRRIGRPVKEERPDRPEPCEAYGGLFILGYGTVPGSQGSTRGLF